MIDNPDWHWKKYLLHEMSVFSNFRETLSSFSGFMDDRMVIYSADFCRRNAI